MDKSDDREPKGAWIEGARGGSILRGQDGSLYFIRDELLNAFRVAGEGQDLLEEAMKSGEKELEQFKPSKESTERSPVAHTGYVRGSLLRRDVRNHNVKVPDTTNLAASTVMCPWFCGHTAK